MFSILTCCCVVSLLPNVSRIPRAIIHMLTTSLSLCDCSMAVKPTAKVKCFHTGAWCAWLNVVSLGLYATLWSALHFMFRTLFLLREVLVNVFRFCNFHNHDGSSDAPSRNTLIFRLFASLPTLEIPRHLHPWSMNCEYISMVSMGGNNGRTIRASSPQSEKEEKQRTVHWLTSWLAWMTSFDAPPIFLCSSWQEAVMYQCKWHTTQRACGCVVYLALALQTGPWSRWSALATYVPSPGYRTWIFIVLNVWWLYNDGRCAMSGRKCSM
jgi:hypothetical protein